MVRATHLFACAPIPGLIPHIQRRRRVLSHLLKKRVRGFFLCIPLSLSGCVRLEYLSILPKKTCDLLKQDKTHEGRKIFQSIWSSVGFERSLTLGLTWLCSRLRLRKISSIKPLALFFWLIFFGPSIVVLTKTTSGELEKPKLEER